jgi:hypothetical protein
MNYEVGKWGSGEVVSSPYGVVRQKDESSRNAGNRNILKLEVMNKKPN